MNTWKVQTVSGASGGVNNVAEVNLRIVANGYTVDGVARTAEIAPALLEALEQAVAYVTRKEAHKGCMDAEQLQKAEEEFARTVPYVATGRWAGDMVEFDIGKARAAIAKAKGFQ